jgi:DNA-binding MarR family transcriptional regulator
LTGAECVLSIDSVYRQLREVNQTRRILEAVASGSRVTQRSLAKDLGVALGLVNLLVKRLIAKGYLRVAGLGTRHVRYLLTARGWDELSRAARVSLQNTVHLYSQTCDVIHDNLARISRYCPAASDGTKPVVFYGAGEVAELAYVSLQRTDLTLSGLVDDHRVEPFFGMPIASPPLLVLEGTILGDAHVIVTTIRHHDQIRTRLKVLGVADQRVSGIWGRHGDT